MKTLNLSILAMAFMGLATVANAQQTDKATDKQEVVVEQKSDKDADKIADADKGKHHRHGAFAHQMRRHGKKAPMMLADKVKRHEGRGMRRGRPGMRNGRHAMNHARRFGRGMHRNPQDAYATMETRFHGNMAYSAMQYMGVPPTIELTDEMMAKMSKKEIKEYNKAIKRARKEMERAQEEMKNAKGRMAEAGEIIRKQMHKVKRLTQKANRIALMQVAPQNEVPAQA